jgi:hypothetical protein
VAQPLAMNVVSPTFQTEDTPLPSSVPMERLVSAGGQILTQRRSKLSDDLFETLLLL